MTIAFPRLAAICVFQALALAACTEDDGSLDAGDVADTAAAGSDASASGGDEDSSRVEAGVERGVRDAGVERVTDARTEDAGGVGDDRRSSGCGKASSGSGEFERRTLRVGSRDRIYYLRVPDSYEASRTYPVIFRWHGTGGDGLSGGLGIEYASGNDAIVVGPDGLVQRAGSDEKAWGASTEAEDLALFDALHQQLAQDYCIDLERVFSYGFSAGGGMTNMLSCRRGDKLRASAAIAGYVWGDQTACSTPVAAWFRHDRNDEDVRIDSGQEARDHALVRNGCGSATMPLAGSCVSYGGCKPGYPVVWCETQGLGHNIAGDTAPAQVWAFFNALP